MGKTELAQFNGGGGPVPSVEARLLAPARRAGYELAVIGTSSEPDGPLYWQVAPGGNWWLFSDHRSDPTAEQYGGVVVPESERAKLARLLREGFSPDRILIGHELGPGFEPGSPLPQLVPTRAAKPAVLPTQSEIARQSQHAVASAETAQTLGRVAVKATVALARGALALGVAVGNVVGSLDPVIVAGVRDPGSGAVTWVEVARWTW